MTQTHVPNSDSTPAPPHKTPRWLLWQRRYVSENVFAFFVCGIIGVACGTAAFALKWLVSKISHLLTSGMAATWPNWLLLLIPVAGIVLTMAVSRYWLRYSPAHGTRQIINALTSKKYRLRKSLMWSSVVTSTLTLGFGGSAGGEGPIAYTGAAIGSNMARAMGLNMPLTRIMLGCGAGAGIAGIFKSPIGGAFYALEVLKMEMTTRALMCLFACALIAALTCYTLTGFTLDVPMDVSASFDPSWLGWVVALGIFCGFYSLYYTWINHSIANWLGRFSTPWVKAVVGGALLAILVFSIPNLYGEGYNIIGAVLNGHYSHVVDGSIFDKMGGPAALILVGGLTLACKCFASSATNNSGGVAGEFAPTLFAGCIAGCFFAACANALFGANLSIAHFALFGMAAVMAGTIHAPFMAIFLTCEMTGAFTYFLPVTIAVAFSLGITRLYTFDRFFQSHRLRFNGILRFKR